MDERLVRPTATDIGDFSAKYRNDPAIKAYTHVSDQFGPFASWKTPVTLSEAPFILEGLLTTDAGEKIKEQVPDIGWFTDDTFALTSLLGYQFCHASETYSQGGSSFSSLLPRPGVLPRW